MRAFGFALVIIGGVVIWLSIEGKLGSAFSALLTGQVPTTTSTTTSDNVTSPQQATKYGTSASDVAKAIAQMPGAP